MARNIELDLLDEINKKIKQALGGCGSTIVTGTDAVSGTWYAVIAQETTEFDVSGCTTDITGFPTGGNDFVVSAGVTLYGNWSAIELNSGSVMALEQC